MNSSPLAELNNTVYQRAGLTFILLIAIIHFFSSSLPHVVCDIRTGKQELIKSGYSLISLITPTKFVHSVQLWMTRRRPYPSPGLSSIILTYF